MKKQPMDWEKISVNHESENGLISKELIHLNIIKPNNSSLKVDKVPK